MTRWSRKLAEPTLIVGDFNIAPLECDVWSHKQLLDVVSHTPIEVETLERLRQAHGWVDLGRRFIPAPRAHLHLVELSRDRLGGESDRGRRLDHMWASPAIARSAVAPQGAGARAAAGCARPTMCRS